MQLPGSRGQQVRDFMYDASGTAGAAALVLPEQPNRTGLWLQNLGTTAIYVEFGGARATVGLSGNALTTFTITNAGFGYTVPPKVKFYGGGDLTKNPNYLSPGLPGNVMPGRMPAAHAVLTGGAVSSIVMDDPGPAYFVKAPMVFLQSREEDPYGAAIPSATSGFMLPVNTTPLILGFDHTICPTDAISMYSSGTPAFMCKYTIGG